jgi:alkanesulfonate monooxygenase SsuD/methylene tetrahydromethanopterin reductase-like flavin-dependent oxidoreductase (luciferase family)
VTGAAPLDRLGIGLWTLQSSATRPGNHTALYRRFAEAAAHAEELGFHSVWAAEHRLWYDGFCPQLLPAQAFVAARTSRLHLGQAMLIGPQHDPAALARSAATLQELSGGRLELGLGLGHRDAEFDALGLRRDRRGRLLEPVLDAVAGIGARLWLGGMASTTLARAARHGAGLLLPQTMLPEELGPLLAEYRSLGGEGAIGILRDVWIEPDPERAGAVRERVVSHYLEEAGAWWVLKGTVGFGNPGELARQWERIERTVTVGSAAEVAARLRTDAARGIDFHCLRLVYDFTAADDLHLQLERVARELPALLDEGVPA